MKKQLVTALALLAGFLPFASSAHEHQTFKIGEKYYQFTVGSLNEPLIVDDKSGVDFSVVQLPGAPTDTDKEVTGTPVEGLQDTLKVELLAGGKKKIMNFTTQYGKPGAYKAVFFPTVATTLTYRVFGTIDGTQIDLPFSCRIEGALTEELNGEEEVTPGVVRLEKTGGFGCPMSKVELGFPEAAVEMHDLSSVYAPPAASSLPLMLSIVALVLSVVSLTRRRKM